MTRQISIHPSLSAIVSNLRFSDPRLADPSIADWRIEYAHRHYSQSEDFGNDTKVFDWLMPDDEEHQWAYVQIQIADMHRTIRELEKYNAELQKTIHEKDAKIKELS